MGLSHVTASLDRHTWQIEWPQDVRTRGTAREEWNGFEQTTHSGGSTADSMMIHRPSLIKFAFVDRATNRAINSYSLLLVFRNTCTWAWHT